MVFNKSRFSDPWLVSFGQICIYIKNKLSILVCKIPELVEGTYLVLHKKDKIRIDAKVSAVISNLPNDTSSLYIFLF